MCVCVCVPCETEHGHSGSALLSPSWTCTGGHQNIMWNWKSLWILPHLLHLEPAQVDIRIYTYIYTPCETGHGHSGHCPTFCISNLHIMRNWRSLWILPNLLQLKPARMENINTAHETAWGHCVCSPWHCLLKFSKPPNTVCQLITVSHGHHHVIRDQGQIFSCSKELFGFRNTVFFYV